jgi:hypothetical protein
MKEKPKTTKNDVAHTIVKAGISAIPLVGSPAAEIFGLIVTPPLTKRRDEWVESIVDGLKELEQKVDGFSMESLVDNEMFVTTTMQATQTAIRNHQEEKLKALRNAVLNAALPNAPEEDIQLIFLNFVDDLTTWHLRILKFCDDPTEWGRQNNIKFPSYTAAAPSVMLEHALPELSGRRGFYDLLLKDLYSKGLINTESLHVMMTGSGLLNSRTTNFGRRFISFITTPLD